jgi:hypothetical protein
MMPNKNFVFPDPGVPRIPLERIDLHSEQAARYIAESRPFVARLDWPCLKWTPDYLKEKVGDRLVRLRRRSGDPAELTITRFLELIENSEEAAKEYVVQNFPIIKLWGFHADDEYRGDLSRTGPNAEMEPLLADLRIPDYIPRDRVKEIFVWARNVGWYDNKSHCEPNAGAGLNLQIMGKKHVWLFPPEDAGLLGVSSPREEMMDPPYFSAGQTVYHPSDEHPEFKHVRVLRDDPRTWRRDPDPAVLVPLVRSLRPLPAQHEHLVHHAEPTGDAGRGGVGVHERVVLRPRRLHGREGEVLRAPSRDPGTARDDRADPDQRSALHRREDVGGGEEQRAEDHARHQALHEDQVGAADRTRQPDLTAGAVGELRARP